MQFVVSSMFFRNDGGCGAFPKYSWYLQFNLVILNFDRLSVLFSATLCNHVENSRHLYRLCGERVKILGPH
jgi:hypothetical protein